MAPFQFASQCVWTQRRGRREGDLERKDLAKRHLYLLFSADQFLQAYTHVHLKQTNASLSLSLFLLLSLSA
jgi:hypothetical protein